MSQATSRILKRKLAKHVLAQVCEQPANHLIIHYSCESFFDIPDGRTPRVTSIAVMYFETGQTKSFSIHKVAEVKGIPIAEIADNYDDLEKVMLQEFTTFVDAHKRFKWAHLNMRNINYGFEAISHRYQALGGQPIEIDDSAKIDIGRLLSDLFGPNYIAHPKMDQLCLRNNLTMTHYLTGGQEAAAFENHEYVKLHQSTLRKVENLHLILDRAYEGTLQTDSNLLTQYGLSPQSLFQIAQENWLVALVTFLLGVIIATVVGRHI